MKKRKAKTSILCKAISSVLLLAMLLSFAIPINVSAAASKSWSNTSELFFENTGNDLGAYYTSTAPTLNGTKETLWNVVAKPLVVDSYTTKTMPDASIASGTDFTLYIMYDNDNLYLFEDNRSNQDSSYAYHILPMKDYVADTNYDGYMMKFGYTRGISSYSGNTTNTARRFYYADNNLTNNNGVKESAYAAIDSSAGVQGYFKGHSTWSSTKGYTLEIKIPWTYLGVSGPVDFGIKIDTGSGNFHVGSATTSSDKREWNGGLMHRDCIGFDPVKLRNPQYLSHESAEVQASAAKWQGRLSVSDVGDVFEISDATELLGLAAYIRSTAKNSLEVNNHRGRIFRLKNDIDLNPGIDWATYNPSTNKDANGRSPSVKWNGFGFFYGTFDGQGHTVSGLWSPDETYRHNQCKYIGFIGELQKDGSLVNIVLDNGYFKAATGAGGGAAVGSLRIVGTSMRNVYVGSNMIVDASSITSNGEDVFAGGLVGRVHDNSGKVGNFTIENCSFNGKFIINDSLSSTTFSTLVGQYNLMDASQKFYFNDCTFTGRIVNASGTAVSRNATVAHSTQNVGTLASNRVYNGASAVSTAYASASTKQYLANTKFGVLPVALADVLSGIYSQSRTYDHYSDIRLVSEVNNKGWDAFGYEITFVRSDGAVTNYASASDVANTNVYASVTAGDKKVTAESTEFSVINENGSRLYAVELIGMDLEYTHKVEITPIWTEGGSQIKGATRHLNINSKTPRVLLVTDTHYTPEYQTTYAGIDPDVRMSQLIRHINDEHEKDPIDVIVFMGDYSLDHWKWGCGGTWIESGTSYTQKFIDEYASLIPNEITTYHLPGNHEQFSNEQWLSITGNNRGEISFVIDDYLFLLWDSFGADLNPTEHSDGTFTPLDVNWAQSVINANPGKKTMLISHCVCTNDITTEETNFLNNNDILCMFEGHHHSNSIKTRGGKDVFVCGGYANSDAADWGFRDLHLNEGRMYTRYIVPTNTYCTTQSSAHLTTAYKTVTYHYVESTYREYTWKKNSTSLKETHESELPSFDVSAGNFWD